MAERLAIVAGAGQFPAMVASGARSAGVRVCVLGLKGFADPGLAELADRFEWIPIARVGRWMRLAPVNLSSWNSSFFSATPWIMCNPGPTKISVMAVISTEARTS